MAETILSDEVMRLITGGSIKENTGEFIRLTQRCISDLRALKPGDESGVLRAAFIGQQAVSAGQIVLEQIQKEAIVSGFPPLSEQEFRKMMRASERVRPEIAKTFFRITPSVFGEFGDKLIGAAEKETGLSVGDLCAAYIKSAREARRLAEVDLENVSEPLFNYLGRAILISLAMLDEFKTDVALENRATPKDRSARDAINEASFAKIVSAAATKAMKDFDLVFAPGGLQVDVLDDDGRPSTLIGIPISGGGSVARANSEMNALIAKVVVRLGSFPIPKGVTFSFRRVE